eukprot:GEMP01040528.1.p1 GENE.GEMP01040528.1~~GEMP01040528.1.p1  ORF type:complete len:394 (-),score=88.50 GEMP01040528.1:620-1801(-)
MPFTCSECEREFTRKQRYEDHLRTHTGERPFVCSVEDCKKTFKRQAHLDRHKSSHEDVILPFVCTAGCGKSFTTKQRLNKHLLSHDKLQCEFCDKTFRKAAKLEFHRRFHVGDGVECPLSCGKVFERESGFALHLRWHARKSEAKKKHTCPDCHLEFPKFSDLVQHRREMHVKLHECGECGKTYARAYALQIHIQTKHQEKRFACAHANCGLSFSSKFNLSAHARIVHEGKKMFVCPCGERFGHRHVLNRHRRTHIGPDGLEVIPPRELASSSTAPRRTLSQCSTAAPDPLVSDPEDTGDEEEGSADATRGYGAADKEVSRSSSDTADHVDEDAHARGNSEIAEEESEGVVVVGKKRRAPPRIRFLISRRYNKKHKYSEFVGAPSPFVCAMPM